MLKIKLPKDDRVYLRINSDVKKYLKGQKHKMQEVFDRTLTELVPQSVMWDILRKQNRSAK